jgi:hypothetical protein
MFQLLKRYWGEVRMLLYIRMVQRMKTRIMMNT